MAHIQPVVDELRYMVQMNPWIARKLRAAIHEAGLSSVQTLDDYYAFLDELIQLIPVRDDYPKMANRYYWILDQESAQTLREQSAWFRNWMVDFARAWGEFLDTPESAKHIESFERDPNFHIEQYQVAPSGWRTFNQFFARHLRPGERPIHWPLDDSRITSPADFEYKESSQIDPDSTITVKGVTHNVNKLVADSTYKDAFAGGFFLHGFLDVNDYHRYHVPVGGTVAEKKHVEGRVQLQMRKGDDGEIHAVDGTGWQFSQMRGLCVLDNGVLGKVAVIPVGMAFVSSVNITPDENAYLRKGDEFGYFLFGASDIILLFQRDIPLSVAVEPGQKLRMGEVLLTAG